MSIAEMNIDELREHAQALEAKAQRTRASAFGVDGRKKNQEIHSPQWIVDAVKKVARDSSRALIDPCASSDRGQHFADINYTEQDDGRTLLVTSAIQSRALDSILYVNPPYNALTQRANTPDAIPLPWLESCASLVNRVPTIVLCPLRLNRERDAECLRRADQLYALKRSSAVFAGYRGTLATPLCVALFNLHQHTSLQLGALICELDERATARIDLHT